VGKVSPAWFGDIYAVLGEVWQGYLPLGAGDDVAEQIGRLLKAMGYENRTAEFFREL
jgi:hypothetical protein